MAAKASTSPSQLLLLPLGYFSEIPPEGRRITNLDQILLHGKNITMLVPGGEGPEV